MVVSGPGARRYYRGAPEIAELADEYIDSLSAQVIELYPTTAHHAHRPEIIQRGYGVEFPWLSHIKGERIVQFERLPAGARRVMIELVTTPGYDLTEVLLGRFRHIGVLELAIRRADEDVRWIAPIHRVLVDERQGLHRVWTAALIRETSANLSSIGVLLRPHIASIQDLRMPPRQVFTFSMPIEHLPRF